MTAPFWDSRSAWWRFRNVPPRGVPFFYPRITTKYDNTKGDPKGTGDLEHVSSETVSAHKPGNATGSS